MHRDKLESQNQDLQISPWAQLATSHILTAVFMKWGRAILSARSDWTPSKIVF
jgi:hypothetical protein